MKTKLEMAHEYLLRFSGTTVADAWEYADAMQAEAEKRKPSGLPESLRERHDFTEAIAKGVENYEKEEWQPDWSQAPDNLVKYFAVDKNGRGGWFISKPTLCSDHWYWSDFEERIDNDHYDYAPSFGYTGDWRNSLRKRPE